MNIYLTVKSESWMYDTVVLYPYAGDEPVCGRLGRMPLGQAEA